MQTRERVWENEKVCVNPSCRGEGLHKLSRSPKLTRVFASGYVNTASILHFFYKINVLQKYIRSGQLYLKFKIKILIAIATAKHVDSQTRVKFHKAVTEKKTPYFYEGSTRLTTFQFVRSQNIFTGGVYAPNPPTVVQLYGFRTNLEGNCALWATWFEVL